MFDAGLGGGGFGGGCIGGSGGLWGGPAPTPPVAPRIAALRIEGAGPADERRLDLVDGPVVFLKLGALVDPGAWNAALAGMPPWSTAANKGQANRHATAHAWLDDPKWSQAPNENLLNSPHLRGTILGMEVGGSDKPWSAFVAERTRLEAARVYLGTPGRRFFLSSAHARSVETLWQRGTPQQRITFDFAHHALDHGASPESVRQDVGNSAWRTFTAERTWLELLRMVRRFQATTTPARPQGKTFTVTRDQLQRPPAEDAPSRQQQAREEAQRQRQKERAQASRSRQQEDAAPGGIWGNHTASKPKPTDPAQISPFTRFLRFNPTPAQPMPAEPMPTDPAQPRGGAVPMRTLDDPSERRRVFADWMETGKVSDEELAQICETGHHDCLDSIIAQLSQRIAHPGWLPEERHALVGVLQRLLLEQARRELTPEAQAAGLTVEDLLSQQIELEAPGLLHRALCWLKNLVGWDDPSCKPTLEVIDMVTAQPPAGLLPPAPDEGAGPDDEDAAPRTGFGGFIERTQSRIGTIATYLLLAGVVVAVGWMVTVVFLAPYVFPFFGRVFDGLFGFGGKGLDVAKDLGGKTIPEGGKAVSAGSLGGGGLGKAATVSAGALG